MKIIFALIMFFTFVNLSYAVSQNQLYSKSNSHCVMPKVIKPMANWSIIATNIGTISAAPIFSGTKLIYSISARPVRSANIVTIDHKTGMIRIKAKRKDNFDVTVKAKNGRGMASNTFNVEIDEEE